MHKGEKYAHQPFVTTPQPGKCAVSTGSYKGPAARKSKSPPFPGSVGRSYDDDLRIRRCRAQSNNVTPVNIYDDSLLTIFLILLSVALVICVLELSSKQHRPRR